MQYFEVFYTYQMERGRGRGRGRDIERGIEGGSEGGGGGGGGERERDIEVAMSSNLTRVTCSS